MGYPRESPESRVRNDLSADKFRGGSGHARTTLPQVGSPRRPWVIVFAQPFSSSSYSSLFCNEFKALKRVNIDRIITVIITVILAQRNADDPWTTVVVVDSTPGREREGKYTTLEARDDSWGRDIFRERFMAQRNGRRRDCDGRKSRGRQ